MLRHAVGLRAAPERANGPRTTAPSSWPTSRKPTSPGTSRTLPAFRTVLEQLDAGLGALLEELGRPGDHLIVTGDHGNDPTIGHACHTREYVPVLIDRPDASEARLLPDAAGLADIGATAAHFLSLDPAELAAGSPLLPL